jgi:membrane peptidoglycan carboxypeptidase
MKKLYPIVITALVLVSLFFTYECALGLKGLYFQVFPDISVLKNYYPVAVGKDGHRIIYKFQKARPAHWLALRQIPKQAVGAILMSEDSSFFQHHGYSPEAIRAAWEYNHKPGVKVKRGGSTITQQVVKNLFLSPEKTLTRKVRELLLAVELERKFSKAKILETYLNIAEWGPNTYGIEQASERYFKKPAANLTAREAATLAFMLPNPEKYQHSIRGGELTQFATERVESILEKMWKSGKISDDEYVSSSAEAPDDIPSL